MGVFVETLMTRVPLDQRRHYLAYMQELKRALADEQSVVRVLVLEDREKLGQFLEIIEYASNEAQAAMAADETFRQRLAGIDRKIEALLPDQTRDRRSMNDRL
jgi:hypothetical protein